MCVWRGGGSEYNDNSNGSERKPEKDTVMSDSSNVGSELSFVRWRTMSPPH